MTLAASYKSLNTDRRFHDNIVRTTEKLHPRSTCSKHNVCEPVLGQSSTRNSSQLCLREQPKILEDLTSDANHIPT